MAIFEFASMENCNGLNGSMKCPSVSRIPLNPNEIIKKCGKYVEKNIENGTENDFFWVATDKGRILTFAPNKFLEQIETKKSQTEKMSYNPYRQSRYQFDYHRLETYTIKNFNLTSNNTATSLKPTQVPNKPDFLKCHKTRESSSKANSLNLTQPNFNNSEKIIYDLESECEFPWSLQSQFVGAKKTPSLVRTFINEQVSLLGPSIFIYFCIFK